MFDDIWSRTFGKSKGVAGKQIEAACEIFGDDISPECKTVKTKAIDYEALAAQLYKQVAEEIDLDGILEAMRLSLADITEELMQLDEFRAQIMSEQIEAEIEKDFFTPTFVKHYSGNSWPIGASRIGQTSKEASKAEARKQNSNDWVSRMNSFTKRLPATQSQNIYSAHDLRPGK